MFLVCYRKSYLKNLNVFYSNLVLPMCFSVALCVLGVHPSAREAWENSPKDRLVSARAAHQDYSASSIPNPCAFDARCCKAYFHRPEGNTSHTSRASERLEVRVVACLEQGLVDCGAYTRVGVRPRKLADMVITHRGPIRAYEHDRKYYRLCDIDGNKYRNARYEDTFVPVEETPDRRVPVGRVRDGAFHHVRHWRCFSWQLRPKNLWLFREPPTEALKRGERGLSLFDYFSADEGTPENVIYITHWRQASIILCKAMPARNPAPSSGFQGSRWGRLRITSATSAARRSVRSASIPVHLLCERLSVQDVLYAAADFGCDMRTVRGFFLVDAREFPWWEEHEDIRFPLVLRSDGYFTRRFDPWQVSDLDSDSESIEDDSESIEVDSESIGVDSKSIQPNVIHVADGNRWDAECWLTDDHCADECDGCKVVKGLESFFRVRGTKRAFLTGACKQQLLLVAASQPGGDICDFHCTPFIPDLPLARCGCGYKSGSHTVPIARFGGSNGAGGCYAIKQALGDASPLCHRMSEAVREGDNFMVRALVSQMLGVAVKAANALLEHSRASPGPGVAAHSCRRQDGGGTADAGNSSECTGSVPATSKHRSSTASTEMISAHGMLPSQELKSAITVRCSSCSGKTRQRALSDSTRGGSAGSDDLKAQQQQQQQQAGASNSRISRSVGSGAKRETARPLASEETPDACEAATEGCTRCTADASGAKKPWDSSLQGVRVAQDVSFSAVVPVTKPGLKFIKVHGQIDHAICLAPSRESHGSMEAEEGSADASSVVLFAKTMPRHSDLRTHSVISTERSHSTLQAYAHAMALLELKLAERRGAGIHVAGNPTDLQRSSAVFYAITDGIDWYPFMLEGTPYSFEVTLTEQPPVMPWGGCSTEAEELLGLLVEMVIRGCEDSYA